jgi:hypothetical protein
MATALIRSSTFADGTQNNTEQVHNDKGSEAMSEINILLEAPDRRPQKGAWAPGNYMNTCMDCCEPFIGDKRAKQCAACAYGDTEESSSESAGSTGSYIEYMDAAYKALGAAMAATENPDLCRRAISLRKQIKGTMLIADKAKSC